MKLCLKLHFNHDCYFKQNDKVIYNMMQLEEDTAHTMNFFYCEGVFKTLNLFITFLKQIYDNVSHENTALIKLETL